MSQTLPKKSSPDPLQENLWWRKIKKRKSRQIKVGNIMIGGNSPIAVQTMTNTLTTDIDSTLKQINSAVLQGADLVRVSCPDEASTKALKKIIRQVNVPIIADIHFHYKRALEAAEVGAACLRINPGNVGSKDKLLEIINSATANDCAIRIGVNSGSLEKEILNKYRSPCPEALVESAVYHSRLLLDANFDRFKVSLKSSEPLLAIHAYRLMAQQTNHPLHLGITEAGSLIPGTVKSAFGIGCLLQEGIGDTIRVSLTENPVEEVKVGFEILKAIGLRQFGVTVISCPSCARQQFDVIKTTQQVEERLKHIRIPITLSIIGCVVNGPGEARVSDIGFTGGGNNTHQVYVKGIIYQRLKDENIVDYLVNLVEKRVAEISKTKNI